MKYANKTTADGMTWLDDAGHPPHINDEGVLTRPFTMNVQYDSTSRAERQVFSTGATLPKTPAASAKLTEQIRAKADAEVVEDWKVVEARQQVDTDRRNAEVQKNRELAAVREARPPRPTVTDPGAVTGNTQGGTVAVDSPAKAPSKRSGTKSTPRAAVKGSAATKPAGKPAGKAKAPATQDGQPSKPQNGMVHVRHMRNPRDAFILIKNPSVFGQTSNWVTSEEFKTAEEAEAWAKKHDLKVVNSKR